jgi:exopolyphosphatase/guanosine-5'-triphosphate,3'-diphosphate pyrophosphatase
LTSPPTVPRWEWRTFAQRFEQAEQRLASVTVDRAQESDEEYVLSVHGDASVKVRDGQLDIKHLQEVDAHGLELWKPVLKASFPLSPIEVMFVMTTLGVAAPSLARDAYTQQQLEDELLAPNPDLFGLSVHKRRTHYVVDDCMVELTDIAAGDETVRTIAIESPEPARVRATMRALGLDGRRNVNMARGLSTLVGLGARRHAVVDVGTNSVKFHVGELMPDRSWRTVVDRAAVTRLGEHLDASGQLAEEPVRRTVDAVAEMVDEARALDAVSTAVVGTAALRAAPNRGLFTDAVRARCGLTVEVLSGEEEGRLAYVATTSALPLGAGPLAVFDSGGGSTQFTFGSAGRVDERFSIDIGAVRVAERHGLAEAVSEDVVATARAAIARELDRARAHEGPDAVVGMGGTVTNLAAVHLGLERYDPDAVHGTRLEAGEVDRQIELYRTRDADDRRAIIGLQPNRAEVILAGACIVRTIIDVLGHTSVIVSDRGLRHGLLLDRFGE